MGIANRGDLHIRQRGEAGHVPLADNTAGADDADAKLAWTVPIHAGTPCW
jgi:hypothetical protein